MEFEGLAAALRNDLIGREEGGHFWVKDAGEFKVLFFWGVHSIQRNQFHWVAFIHIILYMALYFILISLPSSAPSLLAVPLIPPNVPLLFS